MYSKSIKISYRPINSDMYELSTSYFVWRYHHAYLSMSVKWIPHSSAPLFSSKLGCYDSPHTIIIVPFLIASESYDLYDSPYVLYHIHVSLHSFHMSSRHCGCLLSGSIIPSSHWYLTGSSSVCSNDAIIIHSDGCYTCVCCIMVVPYLVLLNYFSWAYLPHTVASFTHINIFLVPVAICAQCFQFLTNPPES